MPKVLAANQPKTFGPLYTFFSIAKVISPLNRSTLYIWVFRPCFLFYSMGDTNIETGKIGIRKFSIVSEGVLKRQNA